MASEPIRPNDMIDPDELERKTNTLRTQALFEGDVAMSPMAEQYMLLAIGALEQAQHFAQLAAYNLMQGR